MYAETHVFHQELNAGYCAHVFINGFHQVPHWWACDRYYILQFFGRGDSKKFCSVFGEQTLNRDENFMENVGGTTVICDKIDGITVISNLVRPPPLHFIQWNETNSFGNDCATFSPRCKEKQLVEK